MSSSQKLTVIAATLSATVLVSSRSSVSLGQDAKHAETRPRPVRTTRGIELLTLQEWADATADSAGEPVTDLNLDLRSGGLNTITVLPGATVYYKIIGELSNDAHQGLALFGLDLVFDGGDLEHADIPTGEPTPGCDNPMINFTRPWGITNPDTPCPPACGFGGTIISGDLVQVGGGQNTINNTPDNEGFPIGPVLLGVATPGGCGPAELVTGSLTAPDIEGTYTLSIPVDSVFANVISAGEPCAPVPDDPSTFCHAEAAGVGDVTNLTIHVDSTPRAWIGWLPVEVIANDDSVSSVDIDGHDVTIYTDGSADTIPVVLEIRIGDWDPTDTGVRLRAWGAALDASIFDGASGSLAPARVSCPHPNQCPSGSSCGGGLCTNAWLNWRRADYVFAPATGCFECGVLSNWRWSDTIFNPGNAHDDPEPFPTDGLYAGTLIVDVPATAERTFSVDLLPDPPRSWLVEPTGEIIQPVDLVSARIHVVVCGGGDCQDNGVPDECDINFGTSLDCDVNGIPDECEQDCNGNLVPDDCDLTAGTSKDCNRNDVPDDCDIASGTSKDNFRHDGIPDECQIKIGLKK